MKKRTGRALTGMNAARARIARDALLQMRLGKLQGESGTYGIFPLFDSKTKQTAPVCDLLSKLRPCQACAKGALFVGFMSTRRMSLGTFNGLNNVTVRDRFRPLRKMFGENFDLIEQYYEGAFYASPPEGKMSQRSFLREHPDDHDRLRVILRSICRNGKFVPPRVGA